jgi:hypothetical protein
LRCAAPIKHCAALAATNIAVRCTYVCASFSFLIKFVMCDYDFYLLQGYTGAAHQNLCSLNNNVGEEGAGHRNINSPTKITIQK